MQFAAKNKTFWYIPLYIRLQKLKTSHHLCYFRGWLCFHLDISCVMVLWTYMFFNYGSLNEIWSTVSFQVPYEFFHVKLWGSRCNPNYKIVGQDLLISKTRQESMFYVIISFRPVKILFKPLAKKIYLNAPKSFLITTKWTSNYLGHYSF